MTEITDWEYGLGYRHSKAEGKVEFLLEAVVDGDKVLATYVYPATLVAVPSPEQFAVAVQEACTSVVVL